VHADDRETYRPWRRRLGWLLLLWLLGVGALGLVTLLLKLVMRLAGLAA
jgi:hypothetical protein